MLTIEHGRSEDAAVAAEMIADTDRELFSYCGGGDLRLWVEIAEWEWWEDRGIYSHKMSRVARLDGSIVGLLIGYSSRRHAEIDWSFASSRPPSGGSLGTGCGGVPLGRLPVPGHPD